MAVVAAAAAVLVVLVVRVGVVVLGERESAATIATVTSTISKDSSSVCVLEVMARYSPD
jgi:hypothetical protein